MSKHIEKQDSDNNQKIVSSPLSIQELMEVLIKHYGLHEGLYDLMIEFKIGTGAFGPEPHEVTPGAMIGISKIGLLKSEVRGPISIDAASINPAKKKK